MSAPAQNSAGFGEARIIACAAGSPSAASQACSSPSTTSGEIEFAGGLSSHATASSPRGVELDRRVLVARVGLRVRVEALAALRAEAALGDQPAQDQRRLEVLAPLVLGLLERREHVVEPAEVRARERPGDHARAHHHPEVDVADARDALLEHEAGLDERLELEAVGERRVDRPVQPQECS